MEGPIMLYKYLESGIKANSLNQIELLCVL